SLRDGLSSAAFDPFATSEFFSQLESLHVKAFQHFSRLQESESDTAQSDATQADGQAVEGPPMMEVIEEIVLITAEEQMLNEPVV
ncbi:hypothetical protein PSYJA_39023, partial [Pseudomonas syringae pv. japonica str. M301072]